MKKYLLALLSIALLASQVGFAPPTEAAHVPPVASRLDSTSESFKQRALDVYLKLPLYFVANQGQLDQTVRYYAQGGGHSLYFTAEEMVVALDDAILRMRFVGAKATPPLGVEKTAARVNYCIGNDPARWQTDIPTYSQVVYRDLYPGIDLSYGGQTGALKYTFVVNAGADVGQIRLAYGGVAGLRLDEAGNLLILAARSRLKDTRPYAYQEIGGRRVEVETEFVLHGVRTYGFAVRGSYDPGYSLVIDPTLLYSTCLGGSGDEYGSGLAVDGAGQAYVTGWTASANFPIKSAYQGDQGGVDAFVAKIDTMQGGNTSLVYCTYLGGSGDDKGYDIAVDGAGQAYLTGETGSTDFPTRNAYQEDQGSVDAFVAKLNAAGNALLYSTYLGGSDDDYGSGLAVDGAGQAYVTGWTESADFPTRNAYQEDQVGTDVFVTRIDPTQSGPASLLYSTYLGGSNWDYGEGLAVDGAGYVYVVGRTQSTEFPTRNACQEELKVADAFAGQAYVMGETQSTDLPPQNAYQEDLKVADAFVAKIDPTQSGPASLLYSTYLGGSKNDYGYGLAVDGAGQAYVMGDTQSTDFPTTTNAYQGYQGGWDAFITRVDTTQSGPASLIYSTYLGGKNQDRGREIAVDGAGHVYVIGDTNSNDFPIQDPYDNTLDGGRDAFVAKIITASGVLTLSYSTYLGGSNDEYGYDIAVDGDGHAYVTGETQSTDFPTTTNAYQETYGGGSYDAFVARLGVPVPVPILSIDKSVVSGPVLPGGLLTYTINVAETGGLADATGVQVTDTVPANTTCCASIGQGGTLVGSDVAWSGQALSQGASLDLTFVVTVNLGAGGTIVANDAYRVASSDQGASTGLGRAVTATIGLPTNLVVNPHTGKTYSTIQAAINEAAPGQSLIAYPGTYHESVALAAGVAIYGSGAERTTLQGAVKAEGSDIGPSTVISGFRITGRGASGGVVAPQSSGGGGIYINDASPTVINNVVEGYTVTTGGGVYVSSGNPVIANNTFRDNKSDSGGGIYLDNGSSTISNNTIQDNSANLGGGIYIGSGDPSVSNNVIEGNSALTGGGIYISDGAPIISNNTIQGNNSDSGGGIYLESGSSTISNNTIRDNSADFGGGVYIGSGESAVSNNVIEGNSALAGGGLYVDEAANPSISSNTLCGNTNFNLYKSGEALTAPGNWWGTNSPISGTDYNASVNSTPSVSLNLTTEPRNVKVGDTATLTITLRLDRYQAADGTVISLEVVNGGEFPGGLTTVALSTEDGFASTAVTVLSGRGAIVEATSACNDQVIGHTGVEPLSIYLPFVKRE